MIKRKGNSCLRLRRKKRETGNPSRCLVTVHAGTNRAETREFLGETEKQNFTFLISESGAQGNETKMSTPKSMYQGTHLWHRALKTVHQKARLG